MTLSKRERAIRDMEPGQKYFLGFVEAEFLGWLEQDAYDCDGIPLRDDVAVFRADGASPRLQHLDRESVAQLLPVSAFTRYAYAHDARIRALGLEHVATDARNACLAGETSVVVAGGLSGRYVAKLRDVGYEVEECQLDKRVCVGPGRWVTTGLRVSWKPAPEAL